MSHAKKFKKITTLGFLIAVFTIGSVLSPFTTLSAFAEDPNFSSDWEQLTGKEKGFEGDADITKVVSSSSFTAAVESNHLMVLMNNSPSWEDRGIAQWDNLTVSDDGTTLIQYDYGESFAPSTYPAISFPLTGNSSTGPALRISTDAGAHWVEVRLNDDLNWDQAKISAHGETILASAYNGNIGSHLLFASYDKGLHWHEVTPDTPSNPYISGIFLSPLGDSIAIYTSSNQEENRQYLLSTDSGATWTEMTTPEEMTQWQEFTFSENGNIAVVGYDESLPQTLLYTSNDEGRTWVTHPLEFTPTRLVFIGSAQTLLAFNNNDNTPYTSADFGETWESRSVDDAPTGGRYQVSSSGNFVYSATQYGAASCQTQIYYSGDAGTSWTERTPTSLNGLCTNSDVGSLSADGSNIALATSTVSTGLQYLFLSHDYGVSWSTHTLNGARQWQNPPTVFVAKDADNVVAAHTSKELYISNNRGLTWVNRTPDTDIELGDITPLHVSSDGNAIVIDDGWFGRSLISTDQGISWKDLSPTDRILGSSFERGLLVSKNIETVVSYGLNDAAMYGGESKPVLYISTNQGRTWSQPLSEEFATLSIDSINCLVADDGSTIAVSGKDAETGESKLFTVSRDGEVRIGTPPSGYNIRIINASSSLIITSSTETTDFWSTRSIQLSKDAGTTWLEPSQLSGLQPDVGTIVASEDAHTIILPGGYSGTAFISIDGGTTWKDSLTELAGEFNYVSFLAISSDGSTIVLTANDSNGAWSFVTSRDGGVHWESQPVPADTNIIQTILHPNGSTIVSIGYREDARSAVLYVSHDSGETWTSIDSPSIYANKLSSFVFSPSGEALYASPAPGQTGYVFKLDLTPTSTQYPAEPSFSFTPSDSHASTAPSSQDINTPQPITNTRPTFSGTAAPGSTVKITVHSDPIVCETTADDEGNWSCTLPSTIPAGVHTILVEVTDPDTEETTVLGPYYVSVAAGNTGQTTVTPKSPTAPNTGVFALPDSSNSPAQRKDVSHEAVIESLTTAVIASSLLMGAAFVASRIARRLQASR
jgi:photosystem II stability/assembly factor-like uncharacterized protein